MPSPYASSLGRLKGHTTSFLSPEAMNALAGASGLNEVAKLLEPTAYGPALIQSGSTYRGAPLLEVAMNRTFVQRNRLAYESAPFSGKPVVGAYLRRWDIQNIEIILSGKAQNRPIAEVESALVSSRDIAAGFFAGTMTLDDFRLLLQQPTLEAVANALVKFGYGGVLLPRLDAYQRTKDIFPLLAALDRDYYERLSASVRFFQGDEWVVRSFAASEIDVRNAMLVLKARDAGLPPEMAQERILPGGTLPPAYYGEPLSARGVEEAAALLAAKFPSLPEGLETFRTTKSLTGFEASLERARAVAELKRLKTFPLALAMTFTFLLKAELERSDLRRIIYGKLYGLAPEKIRALLTTTRIG